MKLFYDEANKPTIRYKFKDYYTFKMYIDPKYYTSATLVDGALEKMSLKAKLNREINKSSFDSDNSLTNYDLEKEYENAEKNKKEMELLKKKICKNNSKSLIKIKKTNFNEGRWTVDEHRRFIEAILKHGNDWKNVQNHIKTRSSTQSRSHSQKFFLKIKNYDLFDFKNRKPCISSLNELAKNLNNKEIEEMTDLLIRYEYEDQGDIRSNISFISNNNTNNKKESLEEKEIKEETKYPYSSQEKHLNKKRKKPCYSINDSISENKIVDYDDTIKKKTPDVDKSQNVYVNYNVNYSNIYNNTNNVNSFIDNNDGKSNIKDDFDDQIGKIFGFNNNIRRISYEDNLMLMFNKKTDDKGNNFGSNLGLDILSEKSNEYANDNEEKY